MKKYISLFLFLSAIFLAHYAFAGHAVYGDGNNYWAYLHTWRFDGNYDFANEFRHVFFPDTNNAAVDTLAPEVLKTGITAVGRTDNNHTAGTALFFLPWYLLADVFAPVPNGYSDFYQVTVGLGVIFYLILAVLLTEKLCLRLTKNPSASRWAALAVILCTPLLYYGSYDVLNSHVISYLLSVSFWFVFFTADFSQAKWVIVSGLLVGLAALSRLQDIFLIVPLLSPFAKNRERKLEDESEEVSLRRDSAPDLPCRQAGEATGRRYPDRKVEGASLTRRSLGVVGPVLIPLIPQFFIWYYLYGLPLPQTYLGAGIFFNFIKPLFHPLTGFLSRTPLLFLSLLSLLFIRKKYLSPMLIFFIITWIIISLQGGWTAAAFGGRMFISTLPFFAVILSLIFTRLPPKITAWIVFVFFLINLVSIGSFIFREKEVNSGRKRGLEERTVQKLHLLLPFTQKLPL